MGGEIVIEMNRKWRNKNQAQQIKLMLCTHTAVKEKFWEWITRDEKLRKVEKGEFLEYSCCRYEEDEI